MNSERAGRRNRAHLGLSRSKAKAGRTWASGFAAATFQVAAAHGQVPPPAATQGPAIERHLPPAEAPPIQVLPTPEAPAETTDDRALGAALTSLVLLGPTSDVVTGAVPPGVDTRGAPRIDREQVRVRLRRFLGKPLSRKLIAEIETVIVKDYRAAGHPFVQVSTPEQEIDTGVLQIRVIEFHIGNINVAGVSPREAAHIKSLIRLKPGDAIDSPRLLEDFDWLNRYPFRTVTPAFSPGTQLGETNFNLAVTDAKPWQVMAGYSNSGSAETGWDRYFVGATIASPRLNDAVLSFQVTGSPDFWVEHGHLFTEHHPLYESGALRLTLPTAPRQAVELTLNAVESNEIVQSLFLTRQQTIEGSLAYRSALSNLLPLPGDVALGLEAVRQIRILFFYPPDPVWLGTTAVDVYQIYGEWSERWTDRFGHSTLDLKVHGSPGGLDPENTAAALFDYTYGRVRSAAYAYGEVDFSRWSTLPRGFGLSTQLTGQYAGQAIPDPQQIAIGGQTAVRGYSLDDGAFDDGVVLRNELRAPSIGVIGKGAYAVRLAPLSFVDFGYGRNESHPLNEIANRRVLVGSVGVGTDVQLSAFVSGNVSVSYPLADAKVTRLGAWHLDARVTVAY